MHYFTYMVAQRPAIIGGQMHVTWFTQQCCDRLAGALDFNERRVGVFRVFMGYLY